MKRPERKQLVSKYFWISTAYGVLVCIPMCLAIVAIMFASTNIGVFRNIGIAVWQWPVIPMLGNLVLLGSFGNFPYALIEAMILVGGLIFFASKYFFHRGRLKEEDKARDLQDL